MSRPEVSVVTTTYRTPAALLEASLQSILDQTLGDLQLVVVVDGAAGAPQEAVIGKVASDDRVEVLTPGRIGRGQALNLGLRVASAPLVAIHDADDESHVERLERQVRVLRSRPDVGLLGTAVRRTRDLDEHATWSIPPQSHRVIHLDRRLLISNPLVHSSVMARQDLLDQVDGYSVSRRWQFDYDLYLRIRHVGGRIAILQTPLVLKRLHLGQVFESDRAILSRIWSSYALQISHAADEPIPQRYGYVGLASLRLLRIFVRGVQRRWAQEGNGAGA